MMIPWNIEMVGIASGQSFAYALESERAKIDAENAERKRLADIETAKVRQGLIRHIEYDSNSLSDEYFRDVAANKPIAIPHNYFPKDNPERSPENRWRSQALW